MRAPLIRLACALGVASGAVEVATRTEPRLGLGVPELAEWVGLSVLMGLVVALASAPVARLARRLVKGRDVGLVLAALLAVHAGLAWRFEVVLNTPVADPAVWGGLGGIALGSLALGLLLDPVMRRLERGLYVVALLALVVAGVRGQPPEAAPSVAPNLLLVTLDTTRPDRLGPYGGPASTPTLDRLAREGVTFDQAVASAPLTEPSHLAILSGLPPHLSGIASNGTDLGHRPELIQHHLAAAGYRTAGFVSGFPLHGTWGWTQGFDVYDDDFGVVPGLHRLSLVRLWEQLFLPGNTLRERAGRNTTDRALAFLDRHAEGQWFAWVHLFDPHAPYEVSDEELEAAPRDGEPLDLPYYWPPPHQSITSVDWLVDAYDGELALADSLVGELIALLEARGVLDNTLVIVTADHGESLTEHDYLFDHGDHLYDASLRVPLIVRFPGRVAAGIRVPCQVGTTSIVPTATSLLRIPSTGVDGLDLSDALLGEPCRDDPVVSSTVAGRFVEVPPVDRSLRSRTHKYIRHEEGEDELFDLGQDPDETRSVLAEEPVLAEQVHGLLERYLEGAVATSGPELDDASIEAMRALGYVE